MAASSVTGWLDTAGDGDTASVVVLGLLICVSMAWPAMFAAASMPLIVADPTVVELRIWAL